MKRGCNRLLDAEESKANWIDYLDINNIIFKLKDDGEYCEKKF